MIIKNGTVFGVDGKFHKASLYSAGGKVVKVEDTSGAGMLACVRTAEPQMGDFWRRDLRENSQARDSRMENQILDAEGLYVIPGLVDVHTHGAMGHDFCDGDAGGLRKIAEYEFRSGVTSFCPTSMTLPAGRLMEIFATVPALLEGAESAGAGKDVPEDADAGKDVSGSAGAGKDVPEDADAEAADVARIVGIHMEGPFLSAGKCGAQDPGDIVSADYGMFKRLNGACGGRVKIVTVAPEQAGNMEFIRRVAGEAYVSLGHSVAGYDEAKAGFEAGANHVTHLFNGMNPYHHRNPGIIGAATERDDVFVELICDGMHVHPAMVRNMFRLFGGERMVLISDSTASCGMPDGEYTLGGRPVVKAGRKVTLAARRKEGTSCGSGRTAAPPEERPEEVIAGSASNLYECMCVAVSFGIPLETAVKAATMNPAKSIGMEGRIGGFTPGAWADCLLMDEGLRLLAVISNERVTWMS